jgi:hypothetical protein
MPATNKTRQLIEFKGTTLPVVVVTLRSLHPDALAEAASALSVTMSFSTAMRHCLNCHKS